MRTKRNKNAWQVQCNQKRKQIRKLMAAANNKINVYVRGIDVEKTELKASVPAQNLITNNTAIRTMVLN